MLSILWQETTIKDVIDILIVAILIYQMLLIIRGTRAVQMLLGVGFLGAMFFIGVSYKLYSLNWILNHFFESFFIILVIIFQDQIRNALVSFGTGGRVFGGLNKEVLGSELDEVVEACRALSRQKVGGIIVFERKNGLVNYMNTGTKIESTIHSDLIYAIFQSSSSLHDGAIIISDGLIASAGCFLPLSKNVEIDRHLGTRHRAALGLSEITDAIIIVLSEETGRMSLCLGGIFYRVDDESELRRYLKSLWAYNRLDGEPKIMYKTG